MKVFYEIKSAINICQSLENFYANSKQNYSRKTCLVAHTLTFPAYYLLSTLLSLIMEGSEPMVSRLWDKGLNLKVRK